jgi:dephospho-CoA kinase
MKIDILTGNIGSGKSTVAEELRNMGIPVISADCMMKDIYRNDPNIRGTVTAIWGPEALDPVIGLGEKVRNAALDDPSVYEYLTRILHYPMYANLCQILRALEMLRPKVTHAVIESATIAEWMFAWINPGIKVGHTFRVSTSNKDARIDRVVERYKKRFSLHTERTGFPQYPEEVYEGNRKVLAKYREMVIRTDDLQNHVNAKWEGDDRIGTVHDFLNDSENDPLSIACSIRDCLIG